MLGGESVRKTGLRTAAYCEADLNARQVTRRASFARRAHRHTGGRARLIAALLIALGLLASAGCAPLQRGPITITATPLPDVIGPGGLLPSINPLTGLAVDDPAVLARRPLAAKISNAPDAVRPQAGIAQADLVFEHLTEGPLTRFTAIFWTHTPPRLGSIRSARLIDLEIPAMYDTLLVYSGASEPIRRKIAGLPFANRAYEGVTVGAPLYYRDTSIEVPHNLFAVPRAVWARAEADGVNRPRADLGGMRFSATPPGGPPARTITIDYGGDEVEWTYDEASGRYARRVDGAPHTDANTGEQVTAANIVLIYAHHQPDLAIVESQWQDSMSFSIELQIWTLGPAAIFRDGVQTTGYWHRWQEEDMLTFWADEDRAAPLYLKPGNTWFEIVPLDFTALTVQ